MKSLLLPIQDMLSRFLFGRRCIGCNTPGVSLCKQCLNSIPLAEATEHTYIYGIVDYGNKLVHDILWDLKYHRRKDAARVLSYSCSPILQEILAEVLISTGETSICFVPIPQYKDKRQTRGFNQSMLIAQWFSEYTDIPVKELLEKKHVTLPQAKIQKKHDRLKNIIDAFAVKKEVALTPQTLYVMIDDVTTTGATFLEGVRALKQAGGVHIIGIALAHGYKKKDYS